TPSRIIALGEKASVFIGCTIGEMGTTFPGNALRELELVDSLRVLTKGSALSEDVVLAQSTCRLIALDGGCIPMRDRVSGATIADKPLGSVPEIFGMGT